jgi:hypothetical protein
VQFGKKALNFSEPGRTLAEARKCYKWLTNEVKMVFERSPKFVFELTAARSSPLYYIAVFRGPGHADEERT